MLYDIYGKMVLSATTDHELTTMDLSQLTAGIYMLNVCKDGRIVKNIKMVRQ